MRQSLIAVCLIVAACSSAPPATPVPSPSSAYEPFAAMFVTRVEAKKVCMINEKVFVDDQIPVPVNGKTYYGCCAMCKTALAEDASKRTATDPVSGKTVDKADAVIGADSIGRVYYFESETNLRAFRPPPG
jgi:YHS domain-containing protein